MNLHFMSASEADIPIIYAQAKNLIDTYEDISLIDYDKVLAWVDRKITTYIKEYSAVISEGSTCGYYRLCQDGELDDLYVLPSFQNRGIGSEIMKKCIEDTNGSMYLYVFSGNTRAIAFYERFGFSVREKVGKTRLIMERKG